MKTNVVKLDAADIDPLKIREAASVVEGGGLVAFPTETVYGIACRARSDSLARLAELKGRTTEKYFTLHIGQKEAVDEYVPAIGVRARKLIRQAWPGPLTMVFELDGQALEKLRSRFEPDVFQSLYKQDSIGIRCPDHAVARALLQQTSVPVVAPSANLTGEPPAISAQQVLDRLAGRIEMLLDAGPSEFGRSSTVVKIGKKNVQMLRPGAYSQDRLNKISQVNFLFVCTGNTCRSPMAEGLFKKYLAEKLQCHVDDLDRIGYKVVSAGIIGASGFPASGEAVTACSAKGIDISAHRNRGLSEELIDESDFIYAMEQVHLQRIVALAPEAANKCLLLAENRGIPDPMGHSQEVYDKCSDIIEKAVKRRISELVV
ncbi:MAG TPA: L-threonylcarbamoyladenylate synthase [Sedimentisphaerales bacterium]|nr:L-threonylcarbamoyladenylate synthase [Sedimentisphaerales bacterium]